jgi:hypothetical protein
MFEDVLKVTVTWSGKLRRRENRCLPPEQFVTSTTQRNGVPGAVLFSRLERDVRIASERGEAIKETRTSRNEGEASSPF